MTLPPPPPPPNAVSGHCPLLLLLLSWPGTRRRRRRRRRNRGTDLFHELVLPGGTANCNDFLAMFCEMCLYKSTANQDKIRYHKEFWKTKMLGKRCNFGWLFGILFHAKCNFLRKKGLCWVTPSSSPSAAADLPWLRLDCMWEGGGGGATFSWRERGEGKKRSWRFRRRWDSANKVTDIFAQFRYLGSIFIQKIIFFFELPNGGWMRVFRQGPRDQGPTLRRCMRMCVKGLPRMDGCAMDGLADGRSRKTTFDFPPRGGGVTRTIDRRLNGISGNVCVCVL